MLSVVIYFYKKVKMKNITLFLTFCWVLWFSQIFAISKILTGIPDVPSATPIISLRETNNGLHFETSLDETIKHILQEELNQTETSDSLSNHQTADATASAGDENSADAAEALGARLLAEKNVIFLPEIPRAKVDGEQVDPVNDTESDTNATKEAQPIVVPVEHKLTVDENQIPVFSEWAQKHLEEAEKKVEQEVVNTSTMKKNASSLNKAPVLKLKGAKNYASPDCGAKIIASNSESSGTAYVLTSTKDEYLLSPCKSRIWFVVELCEAIQAEHIDLANFELFSSSPKNFSVSVSNRFPTRDWSVVGKFIAKDERYVQNFDLHPHLFGKYVRVEINSHYNSEHFCPISLFRVYGISEFEAFETETRLHDVDDIDDIDEDQETDAPKGNTNIFKSASEAVMSIVDTVKKAAAFVKPNGNKTNGGNDAIADQYSIHNRCQTPNFGLVCGRCAPDVSSRMAALLKCNQHSLSSLLSVDIIRSSITKSQICANLVGLDLNMNCREPVSKSSSKLHLTDLHKDYVSHLFSVSYVAAMCNLLAAKEKIMLPFNYTGEDDAAANITIDKKVGLLLTEADHMKTMEKSTVDELQVPAPVHVEIVEQAGLSAEGDQKSNEVQAESSVDKTDELSQQMVQGLNGEAALNAATSVPTPTVPTTTEDSPEVSVEKPFVQKQNIFNVVEPEPAKEREIEVVAETSENQGSTEQSESWETIDESILTMTEATTVSSNEINEPTDGWPLQHHTGNKLQTESVFLRLSNRVKALERNMSLSGQYLEELSRRYKKQVEDLQSSFTKTLLNIEEQNRRNLGRKQELFEQNQKLRDDLDILTNRVLSWKNIMFWCFCITVVQVIIFYIILKIWTVKYLVPQSYFPPSPEMVPPVYITKKKCANGTAKMRRKSAEEKREKHIVTGGSIQRRPSTEALHIIGTYEELLIKESAPILTIGHEPVGKSKTKSDENGFDDFVKIEDLKELYGKPALNEDYELYGPASDLSYSQFLSGVDLEEIDDTNDSPRERGSNDDAGSVNSSSGKSKSQKNKSKSRRLSSPSFFKTPFSGGKVTKDRSTGWEWHRSKKSNSSQNSKHNKKSKSESPEVMVKCNGNATNHNEGKPSPNKSPVPKNRSSSDSVRTSNASSLDGEKKASFRRLLKKMF